MKKIITAILAIIITSGAAQAQVSADTTLTVSGRTVIVEHSDGTIMVEVTDNTGKTIQYPIQQTDTTTTSIRQRVSIGSSLSFNIVHKSPWNICSGGFAVGWVSAPNHPSTMPVEMGKSWEISWEEVLGLRYDISRTTELKLGFGLNWRNYKMTTPDYRFTFDDAGNVTAAPYPDGMIPRNSRLKVFNLRLPLALKQKMPFKLFGQQQWAAVGITLNYSPHASMLTRYQAPDGSKVKTSCDKIGQRRWSYELTGIIGVSEAAGIYIRYQPLSILRGAGQPHFHSLSTGLIFFY